MRIGAFTVRSVRSLGLTAPALFRAATATAARAPDGVVGLATRLLWIEDDGGAILVDTGPGDLENALKGAGLEPGAVHTVVLTHFHADHSGGWIEWDEARRRGIRVIASERALESLRESAGNGEAAAQELLDSLKGSSLLPVESAGRRIQPGIRCEIFDGHTPGMVGVRVEGAAANLLAPADLLPTVSQLRIGGSERHDADPALVDREKRAFIEEAQRLDAWVFLYHDPRHAAIRIGGTPDRPFVREGMPKL